MTRFLKTLHGWLGVVILPWIVLAGLTGIVENHGAAVLAWLPQVRFNPEMVAALPAAPVDQTAVAPLANRVLGEEGLAVRPAPVLTRPGFTVIGKARTLLVDRDTGAYLTIGPYATTLYDSAGRRIGTQLQWGRLFNRLHRAGWPSDRFGTWPADLAAGALTVFGASGLWLFLAPRIRRWRNRKARRA